MGNKQTKNKNDENQSNKNQQDNCSKAAEEPVDTKKNTSNSNSERASAGNCLSRDSSTQSESCNSRETRENKYSANSPISETAIVPNKLVKPSKKGITPSIKKRIHVIDEEKIKNIVDKTCNQRKVEGYIGSYSSVHKDVVCAVCQRNDFIIDRYKCLMCMNYNLCGNCFEQRKNKENHVNEHCMVRLSGQNELFGEKKDPSSINYKTVVKMLEGVSHDFSRCNDCGCKSIIGPRFKCDKCIDFNLCIKCYEKWSEKSNKKTEHFFLVYDSLTNFGSSDIECFEEIGRGSFGIVYKARLLSKDKIVACKIIEYSLEDLSQNDLNESQLTKSFEQESRAYNEINSNFVLKIYGCFIQNSQNFRKFYILTEYMEKGCLFEVILKDKDLSYRRRLSMACNIASGLRRIHDKKFIHRDLRPHNILVNNAYVAKICDMGLAKIQDPNELNSAPGCVPYMPKEFFTRKITEKLDIFTFGLTIYHLFSGEPHVYDRRTNEVELQATLPVFENLINECLSDEPGDRPSAKFLDERLSFYNEVLNQVVSNQKDYSHFDDDDKKQFFIDVYNLVTETLH